MYTTVHCTILNIELWLVYVHHSTLYYSEHRTLVSICSIEYTVLILNIELRLVYVHYSKLYYSKHRTLVAYVHYSHCAIPNIELWSVYVHHSTLYYSKHRTKVSICTLQYTVLF